MISDVGHKMLNLVESYKGGYLAHFEFLKELSDIIKNNEGLDTSIIAMKISASIADTITNLRAIGKFNLDSMGKS
jgi:hypothetical protein